MDVSLVRAEIKSWERDFKARNGRIPQVQDIKDHPAIAEKYKLYKRLCKLTAPHEASPPRHTTILPKSRAAEPSAPLAGFNPFSPVKNSSKQAKPPQRARPTLPNPFATPIKAKGHPRTPSPDPFPLIQPPCASTSALPSHASSAAIARARKRLRGDPVSPSPKKDKRRRVTSQPPSDGGDDDVDDDAHDSEKANLSHLEESPVKPPAGSKPFKILFDERPFSDKIKHLHIKSTSSRSKTAAGLFGEQIGSVGVDSDTPQSKRAITNTRKNGKSIFPTARLPSKDNLFTFANDTPQSRPNSKRDPPLKPPPSAKRPLPEAEADPDWSANGDDHQPARTIQLLRPSPPPPADSYASKYKGKSKEKPNVNASRKKPKLRDGNDDDEDDVSSDGHDKVKIIDTFRPLFKNHHIPIDDEDPEFDLALPTSAAIYSQSPDQGDSAGDFDVNLPENLRRVLALSPSKRTSAKEESVVKGLLYGGRSGDYPAEIWGVGEDERDVNWEDEGAEDEWEGEGVPWEVGEL